MGNIGKALKNSSQYENKQWLQIKIEFGIICTLLNNG